MSKNDIIDMLEWNDRFIQHLEGNAIREKAYLNSRNLCAAIKTERDDLIDALEQSLKLNATLLAHITATEDPAELFPEFTGKPAEWMKVLKEARK